MERLRNNNKNTPDEKTISSLSKQALYYLIQTFIIPSFKIIVLNIELKNEIYSRTVDIYSYI